MKISLLMKNMLLGISSILFTLVAHADVGSAIHKLERIINNNVPSQYRENLNEALTDLKIELKYSSEVEEKEIVCRAISVVTLQIKGVGQPSTNQVLAEESARQNCKDTARYTSDCNSVRFDCQ